MQLTCEVEPQVTVVEGDEEVPVTDTFCSPLVAVLTITMFCAVFGPALFTVMVYISGRQWSP